MTATRTLPGGLAADHKRMLRAALVFADTRLQVIAVWQREARGITPPPLAPTTQQMALRVLRGHGTPAQEQAVRIILRAFATARRGDFGARLPQRMDGSDVGKALRNMSATKRLGPGQDPTGTVVPRFDQLWRAIYAGDAARIQASVTTFCRCSALYGGGLSYVRLADDLAVVLGGDAEEFEALAHRWMTNRLGLSTHTEVTV